MFNLLPNKWGVVKLTWFRLQLIWPESVQKQTSLTDPDHRFYRHSHLREIYPLNLSNSMGLLEKQWWEWEEEDSKHIAGWDWLDFCATWSTTLFTTWFTTWSTTWSSTWYATWSMIYHMMYRMVCNHLVYRMISEMMYNDSEADSDFYLTAQVYSIAMFTAALMYCAVKKQHF